MGDLIFGRRVFLAALILLLAVTVTSVFFLCPADVFFADAWREEFEGEPFLGVERVMPYANVPFVLDGVHGPSDVPGESNERLDALVMWKGLSTSASASATLVDRRQTSALIVTDVAELAHAEDSSGLGRTRDSGDSSRYEIVAPLLPLGTPSTMRRLVLYCPWDSTDGFPPKLSEAEAVRACCPSDLEAALFKVAWRICGNTTSTPPVVVVARGGLEAGKQAIEGTGRGLEGVTTVVPVWECSGGTLGDEVTSSWPEGRVAFVTYTSDGSRHASHLLHSIAPTLTVAPFRVSELGRKKVLPSETLTVNLICAQALVTLCTDGESRWPGSDLMAVEVAKALLSGPGTVASIALMSFYEAQGARLFEGSSEIVKGVTNRRFDSVHRSSIYSIPLIPVMEQFSADGGGGGPSSDSSFSSIELAPNHSVDGLTVRQVGYDAERRSKERTDRDTVASNSAALTGIDERVVDDDSDMEPTEDRLGHTQWGYREARLCLSDTTIDGVRLRTGDRVFLGHQNKPDAENGSYVVVDEDDGCTMQSPIALDLAAGSYKSELILGGRGAGLSIQTWTWRMTWRCAPSSPLFRVIERGGLRDGDTVAWVAMTGIPRGVVSTSMRRADSWTLTIDVPATSVAQGADPAPPWFFPSPSSSKAVDEVEATPCVKDDDCPFFSSISLSHLSRGGCMSSGYCDMPVGVDRVGYRGYDVTTSVVCSRRDGPQSARRLSLDAAACSGVKEQTDPLDPSSLIFELDTV